MPIMYKISDIDMCLATVNPVPAVCMYLTLLSHNGSSRNIIDINLRAKPDCTDERTNGRTDGWF